MSGVQQVGVQATFDTRNFVAGVQVYIDALDRMVRHTRAAASGLVIQPQIVGLNHLAQDIQDVTWQVRLLRTQFQNLNKQQTPFATITPQINAMSAATRAANLNLRSTGNVLNHVARNANAAATQLNTAAKQAGALNTALNRIQTVAKNVNVTFSQTAKAARGAGTAFQTGLGVVFGSAVLHGIRGFTEGFIGLSKAIGENIGFWERLSVSISFFESRSLEGADATLSYAERVRAVGDEAQQTILWIQKLAVESPFTSKEVGTIFRVAQAYGLTAETAKQILPLMLDLGSAAGLDADTLERVALAMGQVQARGKLTGEEIRQLGNAGIPIRDILVKQLGIANEDFEDLVENGAFTADVVIPRIIDSLKQFDGAAEQVTSQTLTGLANAIKETFEIGQVDFFQGIADSIKKTMQEINAQLQDPMFRPRLVAIGKEIGAIFAQAIREIREAFAALGGIFASISPQTIQLVATFALGVTIAAAFAVSIWLINVAFAALLSPLGLMLVAFGALFTLLAQDEPFVALADFFKGLTRIFGNALSAIGRFAEGAADAMRGFIKSLDAGLEGVGDFGEGVMRVFAQGLELGFGAVSAVFQALGSLISFWLEPQSPPRITPNLDQWGTEAANIYLGGWTKADFGILSDLGGLMKDFLNSLVKPGDLQGEVNVIESVIGTRALMRDAIEQIRTLGQVSSDTFARIRVSAGAAGEVLVGYLERYQVLAAATKAVEAAQNALNAITAKYTAILKPLQDRLDAINETQKVTEETKEIARLQAIIASKYVTDARKKSAALELETLLLEQQIRQTENQQEAEEGAAEEALSNAEQQQEQAETALEVYEEQVQLSIDANELEKERLLAIKAVADEQERLRKEKEKELTPLERQLEILKLQREELQSRIEIFRAEHVLLDANATEAERAAAQMTIQREQGESILRGLEIADLGGSLAAIKEIEIVMADITKGKGDEGSPFDAMVADTKALEEEARRVKEQFRQWQENLGKAKTEVGALFDTFMDKVNEINDNLPPWFKLFTGEEKTETTTLNEPGMRGVPVTETFFDLESFPILETGAKFLGIYAFAKAIGALTKAWEIAKTIGLVGGIKSLATAVGGLVTAIGIGPVAALAGAIGLSAALIFNIGGARDKVDELDQKFKEAQRTSDQPFFKWLRGNQDWFGKTFGGDVVLAFFTETIPNAISEGWHWWDDWYVKLNERFETWATGLGGKITDWIKEHIDKEKLKEIGLDMLKGIGEAFGIIAMLEWGAVVVGNFITAFEQALGITGEESDKTKEEVGNPMLNGIVQAFADGYTNAKEAIVTKIDSIKAALITPEKIEQWAAIGTTTATAMIDGLTTVWYLSKDKLTEAMDWLRNNSFDSSMFMNFYNKAAQLGTFLVHGIKSGIDSALGVIREAVNTIIGIFPQWLQKWFLGEEPTPLPPPPDVEEPELPPGVLAPDAEQTNQSMNSLTSSLNALNSTIQLAALPTRQYVTTPTGTNAGTTVNNYNLTTRTNAPSQSIVRDFRILQAMAGA